MTAFAPAEITWLTRAQAAAYAQVSPRTLDRWVREGLRASRRGGVIRIHRDELDAWLKQGEET